MMTFSPILMRIGYGLSWQNAVVSAWGGLRGAVGLALALQVYLDHPLVGGKVRHGTDFNTSSLGQVDFLPGLVTRLLAK